MPPVSNALLTVSLGIAIVDYKVGSMPVVSLFMHHCMYKSC
jgi:hypothetical protein